MRSVCRQRVNLLLLPLPEPFSIVSMPDWTLVLMDARADVMCELVRDFYVRDCGLIFFLAESDPD